MHRVRGFDKISGGVGRAGVADVWAAAAEVREVAGFFVSERSAVSYQLSAISQQPAKRTFLDPWAAAAG